MVKLNLKLFAMQSNIYLYTYTISTSIPNIKESNFDSIFFIHPLPRLTEQ
jgi:hypothetical protein